MDNKYYLPGEVLISQSDNQLITLTSHRIRYQSSVSGQSDTTSFMLEKVSSIQTHYQSAVLLIILGIMLFLGGMGAAASAHDNKDMQPLGAMGMIAGVVCVVLYFTSRKHTATITAECGTKINFEIHNSKREVMYDFINKIEKAKNDRFIKNQEYTSII